MTRDTSHLPEAPEFGHDDFAFEPVPGLPEELPAGETILWQGRPDVWALTRDAMSVRVVGGYFVVLAAWRAIVVGGDAPVADALIAGSWLLIVGFAACALLWMGGLAQARATVYTITNPSLIHISELTRPY